MQEPGKPRGVGFVILLAIVTLGIYLLYWYYKSFAEIRRWRGQGVGGVGGLLLAFIPVSIFLLPSYVGRMYKEDLIRTGQDPDQAARDVPITGWSGLFNFIPFIGGFIFLAKVQGKLNDFWKGQLLRATPVAETVSA
jgi:hypothetical protein